SDIVRRIGFVSKSELEAKLLRIELNRPPDVARAENRVCFFEHCRCSASLRRTRRAVTPFQGKEQFQGPKYEDCGQEGSAGDDPELGTNARPLYDKAPDMEHRRAKRTPVVAR